MPISQYDRASEDAFLRMIIANPKDDMARLIYADWLDEQGESRAEFIRIQIALAGDTLLSAERIQLTDRATALFWKHHRYWNGQIYRQWINTPLAANLARKGGLRGWRYRRGFPEVLDVNAEFFALHAELFLGAAPFQEIILRNPPLRLIEYFTQYEPRLAQFEKIILPAVRILPSVPPSLFDRIRIGLRAQQTITEFREDPLNLRRRVVTEHAIPWVIMRRRLDTVPGPPNPLPAAAPPEVSNEPAVRSVGQILRDVWRRIRGQ